MSVAALYWLAVKICRECNIELEKKIADAKY
jgi:hypothetical protein